MTDHVMEAGRPRRVLAGGDEAVRGDGTSDEGGTEPDARSADTRPLTGDGHSVLFTMVAMLSLEDDMRVIADLNERLAPRERPPLR